MKKIVLLSITVLVLVCGFNSFAECVMLKGSEIRKDANTLSKYDFDRKYDRKAFDLQLKITYIQYYGPMVYLINKEQRIAVLTTIENGVRYSRLNLDNQIEVGNIVTLENVYHDFMNMGSAMTFLYSAGIAEWKDSMMDAPYKNGFLCLFWK